MTRPAIEVSHLSYEYPDKRALDDVSFSLAQGTVTALVGPNGAGKTTLLRLLAALETPYSGTVTIDGIDTQESPRECHAKIGYLSDSFGLYDDLTVWQCLEHTASMRGLRGGYCHKRVLDIARLVGVEHLSAQRAGSLSRGQRQRVGIAQALIHKPQLVILDEPAAGLDPEARHELSSLVRSLRDRGFTLLISSHILAELENYSESMLTLNNGKILGHVPVGKGVAVGTDRQIRLQVLGDPSGALAFLATQPNISDPTVTPDGIIATLSESGEEAQATLLKLLIANNIAVLSFIEHRAGMQDVYLSQVSAKGVSKP